MAPFDENRSVVESLVTTRPTAVHQRSTRPGNLSHGYPRRIVRPPPGVMRRVGCGVRGRAFGDDRGVVGACAATTRDLGRRFSGCRSGWFWTTEGQHRAVACSDRDLVSIPTALKLRTSSAGPRRPHSSGSSRRDLWNHDAMEGVVPSRENGCRRTEGSVIGSLRRTRDVTVAVAMATALALGVPPNSREPGILTMDCTPPRSP